MVAECMAAQSGETTRVVCQTPRAMWIYNKANRWVAAFVDKVKSLFLCITPT